MDAAPLPAGSDVQRRTLWRGILVLQDGTNIPGTSIVTTMRPWDKHNDPEWQADAELCLALEMVRHHALCVRFVEVRADGEHAHIHGALPETGAQFASSGTIQIALEHAQPITTAYFARIFGNGPVDAEGQTCAALHVVYDPNVTEHSLVDKPGAVSSPGVLEFVVFARRTEESGMLEVIVGRRIACARTTRSTSRAEDSLPHPHPLPRPDDPLPRAWESSDGEHVGELETRTTALDARVRKRGRVDPHAWVRTAYTPGRRGEKRARRDAPAAPPPLKAPAYTPISTLLSTVPPQAHVDPNVEQANRALIKRLVRYQLTGRGMERAERHYEACFQAAYFGTCVVFRHTIAACPLERRATAHVVAAHLGMYADPTQL
ncbi:hypothetical protein MVES_000188 [Malassezia vespertilionis]|uniref:Sld7 C-terminal domain-containing protein n=2 Tax=Malassezia vespertilionis TaxID=2020962 RepID=A0A2N1JHA0_9BASI|nr:hypothetical protein MVES_000188 [Malassezia vespertilionis]